jgi:hypothetical protein
MAQILVFFFKAYLKRGRRRDTEALGEGEAETPS